MKKIYLALLLGLLLDSGLAIASEDKNYFDILNTSHETAKVKHQKAAEQLSECLFLSLEQKGWTVMESPGFETFIRTYYKDYSHKSKARDVLKQTIDLIYTDEFKCALREYTDAFVRGNLVLIAQAAERVTQNWSTDHKTEFNENGLVASVQVCLFKKTLGDLVMRHMD